MPRGSFLWRSGAFSNHADFVGMCDAAATLLEYFLLGRRRWNKRHPNGLCPKDLLGLEELSGGAQT